ncbi:unnamed protein product [Gadus morhua 'NCC']
MKTEVISRKVLTEKGERLGMRPESNLWSLQGDSPSQGTCDLYMLVWFGIKAAPESGGIPALLPALGVSSGGRPASEQWVEVVELQAK